MWLGGLISNQNPNVSMPIRASHQGMRVSEVKQQSTGDGMCGMECVRWNVWDGMLCLTRAWYSGGRGPFSLFREVCW